VFEHALKVRVGSFGSSSSSGSKVAENGKGKGKENGKDEVKGKSKTEESKGNMMGKINNLVSSDLDNISGGRDFLIPCENIPFDYFVVLAINQMPTMQLSAFRFTFRSASCFCIVYLAGGEMPFLISSALRAYGP
jgi:hypothetical protein